MNRRFALSLLCCFALSATGCEKKSVAPNAAATPAKQAQMALPVLTIDNQDIATITTGFLQNTIEATGTLKAVRQVVIKSKTIGEVLEFNLLEGQAVKKGQTVARIDEQESHLRLRERQAQVQSAKAQLDLANRTFENQQQLFQKGFISQTALDNAQTQLNVARANLDSLNASLALANKGVTDNRLTTPISGIVAERYVQRNEKVGIDTRLMLIVDDTSLELEALLPVADSAKLAAGAVVSVKPEGTTTALAGKITRVNPTTTVGTRLVPVHIEISNQKGQLKQGQFASVSVVTSQRSNVLSVAPESIRESGGRSFVYVVSADNMVTEQNIQLGQRGTNSDNREAVEVIKGLTAGMTLISTNLGPLRAGSKVQIRTASKS